MLMNSFHWPNRSSHPHPLPPATLAWGELAVPATANIPSSKTDQGEPALGGTATATAFSSKEAGAAAW